ncbi:MAG TPA: hypothetical protein VGC87_04590 [Pyrinomonadaceae bacterium]|jgi:hypothetical protein
MTTNGAHLIDFAEYLKGLPVSNDSKPEVVLLTCMDFRFFERVIKYMKDAGLIGKYYHLILAGAALGAVVQRQPADPAWHKTFFDHLKLALELDPDTIKRVIVLEHKNCKAYEKFGMLRPPYTDAQERAAHATQVGLLSNIIVRDYELPVDSFFLTLDEAEAADESTITFDQLT